MKCSLLLPPWFKKVYFTTLSQIDTFSATIVDCKANNLPRPSSLYGAFFLGKISDHQMIIFTFCLVPSMMAKENIERVFM